MNGRLLAMILVFMVICLASGGAFQMTGSIYFFVVEVAALVAEIWVAIMMIRGARADRRR